MRAMCGFLITISLCACAAAADPLTHDENQDPGGNGGEGGSGGSGGSEPEPERVYVCAMCSVDVLCPNNQHTSCMYLTITNDQDLCVQSGGVIGQTCFKAVEDSGAALNCCCVGNHCP